ncbi:MAG: ATP-binding protein [bacterium]|nr:ATP-binding protein [bacterium]
MKSRGLLLCFLIPPGCAGAEGLDGYLPPWAQLLGFGVLFLLILAWTWRRKNRALVEHKRYKELADQNRLVLQSVDEGIFGLDLDGRCTFINEAACRMFGYRRAEVIGADMHLLTHHTQLDGTPFPKEKCPTWDAMYRGQVTRVAEDNFWNREGQPFMVTYSTTPLSDQGQILGAVTVFRDLTRQKQDQQRIAEQRATLEGLFTGSAAMMGVCEQLENDLLVVAINPAAAQFFGYPAEVLTGQRVRSLGPPERYLKLWSRQFEAARTAGTPKRYTYRHHLSRRECRWLEVDVFYTGMGELGPRYTFVALDQTERKRNERQLIQAKQEAQRAAQVKTDFLANISHEIRTPLNSVLVFAQLLAEKGLTEQQKTLVNPIQSAGKNLLTLINDLLDFRKIEVGHLNLNLEGFALSPLLDEVLEGFMPQAESKGLKLVRELPDPLPPPVLLDPERLRQILMNLLGNAVKFSDQGEIRLLLSWKSLGKTRLSVTIKVLDQGPGIAAQQQQHLFEAFTQGKQKQREGAGLGLAIAKQLTQLMGGELSVDSQLGQGTCFTLFFATVPLATVTQSTPTKVTPLPEELINAKIWLLMNPPERPHLEQTLSMMGVQVYGPQLPGQLGPPENLSVDLCLIDLDSLSEAQQAQLQVNCTGLMPLLLLSQQEVHFTSGYKPTVLSKPVEPASLRGQLVRLLRQSKPTVHPPEQGLSEVMSHWDAGRWALESASVLTYLEQVEREGLLSAYQGLSERLSSLASAAQHAGLAAKSARLEKALARFDISSLRQEATQLRQLLEQLTAQIDK